MIIDLQNRKAPTAFLLLAALPVVSIFLSAIELSGDRPATRQLDSLQIKSSELLTTQCVACHTVDLITSQRLTRDQWRKSVQKMVNWGATFDTTETDFLVDFLSAQYGPSSPEPVLALRTSKPNLLPEELSAMQTLKGDPTRGMRLYSQMCESCHAGAIEGALSGTILEDNPILDDREIFWSVTLNGRHDMPGFRDGVTHQELADILAWLKTTY